MSPFFDNLHLQKVAHGNGGDPGPWCRGYQNHQPQQPQSWLLPTVHGSDLDRYQSWSACRYLRAGQVRTTSSLSLGPLRIGLLDASIEREVNGRQANALHPSHLKPPQLLQPSPAVRHVHYQMKLRKTAKAVESGWDRCHLSLQAPRSQGPHAGRESESSSRKMAGEHQAQVELHRGPEVAGHAALAGKILHDLLRLPRRRIRDISM